ncbi:Hypothetical predicted protein [Xyrichtys novacula]|uniref:Uncharacterized protein n=1 Tax=Xyrichtys novacula TaxID=13765 RepID=A0AAV1GV96_XYRNO|nr:Hypothetical predicted protein [Xyrichtys novacula]
MWKDSWEIIAALANKGPAVEQEVTSGMALRRRETSSSLLGLRRKNDRVTERPHRNVQNNLPMMTFTALMETQMFRLRRERERTEALRENTDALPERDTVSGSVISIADVSDRKCEWPHAYSMNPGIVPGLRSSPTVPRRWSVGGSECGAAVLVQTPELQLIPQKQTQNCPPGSGSDPRTTANAIKTQRETQNCPQVLVQTPELQLIPQKQTQNCPPGSGSDPRTTADPTETNPELSSGSGSDPRTTADPTETNPELSSGSGSVIKIDPTNRLKTQTKNNSKTCNLNRLLQDLLTLEKSFISMTMTSDQQTASPRCTLRQLCLKYVCVTVAFASLTDDPATLSFRGSIRTRAQSCHHQTHLILLTAGADRSEEGAWQMISIKHVY